ncbi:hypothetical protein DL95DRAFT_381586 [Leptodontidium sp. 2 PMI_412]|nr:hypothetical protein DL95DRAFT_381586 [Leptodontidium sp. 2 PMI_412]
MHPPNNQLFFNVEESSIHNSEIDQYFPASRVDSEIGLGDPALYFALPHVANDAHAQNLITSTPHATPSVKVRNTLHVQQQPFGMFQTQLPTQDRQYDITQTMSSTRADVGDLQDIASCQTSSQHSSGSSCHQCHWAQCKETFQTGARLQTHVKSHTKPLKNVYICLWRGCSKRHQAVFHLNKHLQAHTRPYACAYPGCTHYSATSRDHQRHNKTHGMATGDFIYYCPIANCEHSVSQVQSPFKRLDHAKRHIHGKHGQALNPIIQQI